MKDQEREGKNMMIDEMELVGRMGDVEALPEEAFQQARTVLQAAIALEAVPRTMPRPLRSHHHRRAIRGTIAVGVGFAAAAAAVALVVAAIQPPMSPHGSAGSVAAASGAHTSLMRLADDITVNAPAPAGNATLVIRTTAHPGQTPSSAADLYTDSGNYYYAPAESGLPAEIAANNDRGDGLSAREIAAALYAVNGDLTTARNRMADASLAAGTPASSSPATVGSAKATPTPARLGTTGQRLNADNDIWENSMNALIVDGGNPQVRAGVLRILSTLHEVTVTNTTTGGQPTLTLTATAPALPANYRETLTVDAHTGIPMAFAGGTPGRTPDVTITYQVSRVTLADIAAGKF